MVAAPVSLDNGPPLPPNLQPQPQATVGGLAGQPQPANPSGSASLQQAVIQKLMFTEQTLQDIGKIMPAAAPLIDGFVSQLRKGMGALLAQGAQPPSAGMGTGAGSGIPMGPGGFGNAPGS